MKIDTKLLKNTENKYPVKPSNTRLGLIIKNNLNISHYCKINNVSFPQKYLGELRLWVLVKRIYFRASAIFQSQGSKISARSIRFAPVLKIFSTFRSNNFFLFRFTSKKKLILADFENCPSIRLAKAALLPPDARRWAGFERRARLRPLLFFKLKLLTN